MQFAWNTFNYNLIPQFTIFQNIPLSHIRVLNKIECPVWGNLFRCWWPSKSKDICWPQDMDMDMAKPKLMAINADYWWLGNIVGSAGAHFSAIVALIGITNSISSPAPGLRYKCRYKYTNSDRYRYRCTCWDRDTDAERARHVDEVGKPQWNLSRPLTAQSSAWPLSYLLLLVNTLAKVCGPSRSFQAVIYLYVAPA